MRQIPEEPGPIESAVLAHHPTQAVMYEAGALDRELVSPQRSWSALLRSVGSFAAHYPSILLHSPAAIEALGRVCREGMQEAPGLTLQKRSASLLMAMLGGIVEEMNREGAEQVRPEVSDVFEGLLSEVARDESVRVRHGHLVPVLLRLGKQILGMGDSQEPERWLASLAPLTGLLLKMLRVQIEGEPVYDGRWDAGDQAGKFLVALLGPVHRDRILEDIDWLEAKQQDLSTGSPPVHIFLEVSAYTHRDDREKAWEAYFVALAERIQTGQLPGDDLRQLCLGISHWIEQASDRRLLQKLARVLRASAPAAAAGNGLAGLLTVLDTFGRTILELLEGEAGCGEADEAHEDMRAVVAEVITGLLELADRRVATDAVQLGIRLRTGPITGEPFSLQDVIWRLELAGNHPRLAGDVLLSMISGFSLEDILVQDDRQRVGRSLANLLGRDWDSDLLFPIRTLVRKTPLSPFHLGGPTTRAHLLALDPEAQKGSYLYDLKQKVLSRSGPENLKWIERVLQFWQTGSPEHLDGLASPRSLTNLPNLEKDEHHLHLRELLSNLSRHVPVADKSGVEWLARMPDPYYQVGTLLKVAGFSGCNERSVSMLVHLASIYRDLSEKYLGPEGVVPKPSKKVEHLLERSQSLLESRRILQDRLFHRGGLDDLEPLQRLEVFEHEMALVLEEDRLLEDLASRHLQVLDRENRKTAEMILGHMLLNASMSGLGTQELVEAAEHLQGGQLSESESMGLLRRVAGLLASIRNHLAERLQPHVEDSVRRLMENVLARSTPAYRGMLGIHRHRGVERVAVEMGDALLDELLSADGGFQVMENFVHRMLHMLEQY